MQEKREKKARGIARKAILRTARLLGCNEKDLTAEKEALGYTNAVFKVTKGTQRYLYKEYSQKDHQENTELEWQKFFQFPPILFVSPEYRIDEYIEHFNMSRKMVRDKDVLIKLAKEIGRFHKTVPPEQMAEPFLDLIKKTRERVSKRLRSDRFVDICQKIEGKIQSLLDSSLFFNRPCLCHNDIQFGNILVLPDKTLKLIDFEHVALNYPTVEIANLFNEMNTNYQRKGAPVSTKSLLSPELERLFISEYLKEVKAKCSVDDFLSEVERMKCIPQYYWILWAINEYLGRSNSKGSFDYFTFMSHRLDLLHKHKLITITSSKEIKKAVLYSL
ncbi:choline/ethanolamine kinase [Nematocida homosporus]|uniref:choline/ethanolamine kinase n=1 Tax=Nematocida homosporus TaxID=1912981 RepID=UPI0022208BCF|nr:choline/ethanolamine kinase [Nematocida homosporus]KAI5184617.1 choline/ethanolamine kinase [Nematocida homosporus]